jgi:hypothetical protein
MQKPIWASTGILRCKSILGGITFLDLACWSRWRGHRVLRKAATQPRGCGVGVMDELYDTAGPGYRPWTTANASRARVAQDSTTQSYLAGEMYRRGRGRWSPGSSFSLERRGYSLTIFTPGVTEEHCQDFSEQSAVFALVIESPLLVLCHRFGNALPWSATPYAYPLDAIGGRMRSAPPECLPGRMRARLRVNLVDAESGILCAQRSFALSPRFSVALNDAVQQQSRVPFDADAYLAAIVEVSLGTSSVSKLAQRATVRAASPR